MTSVVFVAPFFAETTLRFVQATADLPGVRLGLVSQDPDSKLPPVLRAKLAAHYQVDDALDAGKLVSAVQHLGTRIGPATRILGTLEELQVPLAEVRQYLRVDGLSVEAAKNFRDKSRMKTVLAAAGLPCARHRLVATTQEAWDFVQAVGYPIVVKPPAGAGSRNTFRINGAEQLHDVLAMSKFSAEKPALFEEFIVGQEQSFDSVLIHGHPVWCSINHYYPGPLEVLENPWIQWAVLLPREADAPEYEDIRRVAYRSLEVLGMKTGLTHMEWFRRKDGTVAVSEVAARPPGAQFTTLISYAHDFDLYRGWAHLMVYDEFPAPERKYAAGAAYLRGQGEGKVIAVHGLDKVRQELGDLVVEAKLPKPGQSPTGTYEGEGYVILRHPETKVVQDGLKKLITTIRVELG
ncbi:MAG: ATP-grasp domain-containing protein [Candidatus Eisenbacteria bacterium]|nr:ATP-grasp domain-containing protein [Candidatus Eisenbacteria bacterium]MCC7141641.1 ATP-grasp domain-containing protein [Candidatus Eisenbacteria bacterium]